MFNYEKVVKKLKNFGELSKKKQSKLLTRIFIEDEFRDWYFNTNGDGTVSSPMIHELFEALADPAVLRKLTDFIDPQTMDRTSMNLVFMAAAQATEQLNGCTNSVIESRRSGDISDSDAKKFKQQIEHYQGIVAELLDALRHSMKGEVNDLANRTNLPKSIIFATMTMVPGRKYIPKFKVHNYVNLILPEIYSAFSHRADVEGASIKWGSYFGNFFGSEMTTSAAISILTEGVKHIDQYRDSANFDSVCTVWDSLTNFALSELDRAPENVRRQMMDIYVKRIDRMFRRGNGQRLRVDMLNLPAQYRNLSETVRKYADSISRIVNPKTSSPNNEGWKKNEREFDTREASDDRRANHQPKVNRIKFDDDESDIKVNGGIALNDHDFHIDPSDPYADDED